MNSRSDVSDAEKSVCFLRDSSIKMYLIFEYVNL